MTHHMMSHCNDVAYHDDEIQLIISSDISNRLEDDLIFELYLCYAQVGNYLNKCRIYLCEIVRIDCNKII